MNKLFMISLLALMVVGCAKKQINKPIGMANPATVYCESIGGKSELVKDDNGWYGICHLPDGSEIEEWTLYRDKHK